MAELDEISQKMDAASKEAAKELPKCKTAKDVANWMRKWYPTAGYKRLSRELIRQLSTPEGGK